MSTLEQIRHRPSPTWDSLGEGWQALQRNAAQALTRFTQLRRGDALETAQEQLMARGARWGMLPAELQEDEQDVVVRIEIPGMDRESFDIAVIDGRYLRVRGEKRPQREPPRGRYPMMECAYGGFERAVALPAEVDDSHARASYRRGVLQVVLPKVRGAGTARRIEVTTL